MTFMQTNKWLVETLSDDFLYANTITQHFYSGKSEFQSIDVLQTGMFGRCLVLDNKMQSAEHDEFIYHESLVHPAMLAHPNPKNVYVGGGGEGATIREVLRHKSVEKCMMVDIDKVAVDTCKEYLSSHHEGAFDDPRLELRIDDAKKVLLESDIKWDVVVLDLADPLPGGPCYTLYCKSFYEMILTKLNPGGIILTQSGPAGPRTCTEVCTPVGNTFKQIFTGDRTTTLSFFVPSFCDIYSVAVGVTGDTKSPHKLTAEEVDALLAERLKDPSVLKFYDGSTHMRITNPAKYLREALSKETTVITEDNPTYIYGSTNKTC